MHVQEVGWRNATGAPMRAVGIRSGIEALITSEQAAVILGLHPKVVERKAKRGEIPGFKLGKYWRYRASALDGWIESQLHSTCQPCRKATSF